jgi:uncharacterized protein YkwD
MKRTVTGLLIVLGALFAPGCYAPLAEGEDGAARLREARECLTPEQADQLVDQTIQLINLERTAEGLAPVVPNEILEGVANDFACRMIEGEFFAHQDPETLEGPGDRAVAARYPGYLVGENLAEGPTTAAEVVKAWMASPSHKDVILSSRWKEVGLAVRNSEGTGFYWVLEFGDPVRIARQSTPPERMP